MGAAIVFVFLFSVGILVTLFFHIVVFLHILSCGAAWVA
jgi:hypothetical protein